MNILLTVLLFLSYAAGTYFRKDCSGVLLGRGKTENTVYILITCLTACVFFVLSAGFRLPISVSTAFYAFLYAVVVLGVIIVDLIIFRYVSVAVVAVTVSAGSMLLSTVTGFLAMSEKVTFIKLLRVAIMLAAIFFVFFGTRKEEETREKEASDGKHRLRTLLLLAAMVILDSASTLICKWYALDPNGTGDNALFFYTNLFLLAGVLLWYLVTQRKNLSAALVCLRTIKPREYLLFTANTVASNAISLIMLIMLGYMDVSVMSPILSAVVILSGAAVSLLLREKMNLFCTASVLLAVIAVVI